MVKVSFHLIRDFKFEFNLHHTFEGEFCSSIQTQSILIKNTLILYLIWLNKNTFQILLFMDKVF